MADSVLSLRGFGVAFGERIILSAVDLDVRDRHVTVLLGPAGTGKSTLLRTIAGFNDASPSLRTWGCVEYAGRSLWDGGDRPALVAQRSRLMMSGVLQNLMSDLPERRMLTLGQQRELARRLLEQAGLHELMNRLDDPVVDLPIALQRHLSIVRLATARPRLLCLDEPTTGLTADEARRLLAHMETVSRDRALLVVLHNQEHARVIGGTSALLAGGIIHEIRPTTEFLARPRTRAAMDFVRTGSCCVGSPGADPATLDPDAQTSATPPPEAKNYVSDAFGPRGFLWLKRGRLAGTPRPGIFLDRDYDLRALKRVGISRLITLTESAPDIDAMAAHGIGNVWFPIRDMRAPTFDQAEAICRGIEASLAAGEGVAVHCRAGLGRTGTVLAAYLIWEGLPALDALEQARRIEPRWVQSDEQVQFLERFSTFLTTRGDDIPSNSRDSSATTTTSKTTER